MTTFNLDVKYKDGRIETLEDVIGIKYIPTDTKNGLYLKLQRFQANDSLIMINLLEGYEVHDIKEKLIK